MHTHSILSGLAVVISLLSQHSPEPSNRDLLSDDAANLTFAMNTFKSEFKQGEPVKLAVALVNSGTEPVYLPPIDEFIVHVADAESKAVRCGPIPTPPAAPPDHSMNQDGHEVYVQPVWELLPGTGRAVVVADALKYHRVNLTTGTYRLYLPATRLSSWEKRDLIVREGLKERLWSPVSPKGRVGVFSANYVMIHIRE